MEDSKKPHTHTAYAYQRLGRKSGRMLECGSGRIDTERNVAHVAMNRQPIGGYTGYIILLPFGEKPEPPAAQPQRPGESEEGDEEEA